MQVYKSVLPPVCVFGPRSKKWYVVADGVWHQTTRNIPWSELKNAWEKVTYGNPKTKSKEVLRYFVEGSRGNKYEVTDDQGNWKCSCPAYGFGSGRHCKHIISVFTK